MNDDVENTSRAQFCGMRRSPDLPKPGRPGDFTTVPLETFSTVEHATDPPYVRLLAFAGVMALILLVAFLAIMSAVG